jgi:hypothetical protein
MFGSLGQYLKSAFTWRWNLLALAGGVAFSLLSPVPAAGLAIVAAAEIAYLATLVSFPKFRRAIDAQSSATPNTAFGSAPDQQISLTEVLNQLAPGPRKRFLELRQRCLTLQGIANRIGGGEATRTNELKGSGLDKLLWVHLRLLIAQQGLWRFLEETDVSQLDRQLVDLKARQEQVSQVGQGAANKRPETDERMLKSVTDAIATVTMRIDNYRAAERNSEFVDLEIDRIENKILALSEMSVNNQNPDFITAQVDAVADSMTQTESAMRELDALTGLGRELTREPPKILAGLVQ